MMQSVLGLPVVIATVKEDFYFVATLGWWKKNCELGAKTKCCLLHDRLAKGEREKMVIMWDSARMCGATNVQSWQVYKLQKIHQDHHMQKFPK